MAKLSSSQNYISTDSQLIFTTHNRDLLDSEKIVCRSGMPNTFTGDTHVYSVVYDSMATKEIQHILPDLVTEIDLKRVVK